MGPRSGEAGHLARPSTPCRPFPLTPAQPLPEIRGSFSGTPAPEPILCTMKRAFLILVAAVALYVGGRAALHGLASDETRILWLVERMEEGYNESQSGQAVSPLAEDWRHADYAVDREALRGHVFQNYMERDKSKPRRVTVDYEALLITVDGDRATLEAPVGYARLENDAWNEGWRFQVFAELERRDGGWLIVKSRHEDLHGTQLSR